MRSKPRSRAICSASRVSTTPTWLPFSSIRRTWGTRIRSLIRCSSLLWVGIGPLGNRGRGNEGLEGLDGLDGLLGVNAIIFLVLQNLLNPTRVTEHHPWCQAVRPAIQPT